MAVADRDDDAEWDGETALLPPPPPNSFAWSSWVDDADDGDEEFEGPTRLLAMYRWRELLRFGIGMLLRREGDVASPDDEHWEMSMAEDDDDGQVEDICPFTG